DYLVVVGALHLVGEDGLPQLLEQRGVRILQMHELRGIE
ncbi:MAG: TraB/GumN family protein, partial [Gammaproteobacteria bacterium]|nr:TraB/GumN family protein [Gammaproteobacteria bacterium]